MTPRKFVCFSAALTLGAAWAVPAAADQAGPQGMWGLCAHLPPVVEDHASTVPPHAAQTVLSADYAEGREDHLMRLEGGVVIQRGAQRLWADRVLYDAATDQVTAEGHVRLRQEPLEMEGERGVVNLTQDRGTFEQTRYRYTLQHARGEAETITRLGPSLTRLDRATYTTCDPGRKDWSLKARRVYLHHDDDVGTAQHIVLRALDVPVFYFPYLSFPLSGARKTGFLWPSIGYGNETGLDISTPFYWNIAPHRDATLTPRYLQKRGLLAKGEFRYLNENSRGQLNLEYLPDDKLEQKNRASARYRHHHRLASHWQADIDANYVSDPLYFSQLGGSLSSASTTHVSRRLDVRYSGEHSRFLARAQAYQTVDRTIAPASRPYQQLPRLEYQAESPWQPLGIASALDAQWVRYYRADSVRGRRLDVKPSISWPYRTPGLFFEPKLSLEHTRYQLSGLAPGDPASPGRTVPLYSADAGVILEKAFPLGRRNYLHTLEPRLYFLRVPYRDQSELPVFDTSVAQLSYPQLFRDNRFTGPDRVGDAQQLSAGFTTRLIDAESGHEPLRFSVGRIFYFDDRRVQLSGTLPETRRASDYIGELDIRPAKSWYLRADLQWSPEIDRTERASLQFHYQNGPKRIFNAAYRFRRNSLLQTDVSVLWPLRRHWQIVGRWNYSLHDHRPLETLAGIQYESCCWVVRVTSRRYLVGTSGGPDDERDSNRSLYLQLELKGLGTIGNSIESILERGILGYRSP